MKGSNWSLKQKDPFSKSVNKNKLFVSLQASRPAETAAAGPARPQPGLSRRLQPRSPPRHQPLPTDVTGKCFTPVSSI